MVRMNTAAQALAVAKMAVKRGTANEAQKALVAEAEAKANAAKAEAAKARREQAKAAAQWAKDNADEIARVQANNYYDQMEIVKGSNTMKAGIRYYHLNEDGTRDYQK